MLNRKVFTTCIYMFEYTWLVAFMLKLQISGKKVNMLMIFQNLHKGLFFSFEQNKMV